MYSTKFGSGSAAKILQWWLDRAIRVISPVFEHGIIRNGTVFSCADACLLVLAISFSNANL